MAVKITKKDLLNSKNNLWIKVDDGGLYDTSLFVKTYYLDRRITDNNGVVIDLFTGYLSEDLRVYLNEYTEDLKWRYPSPLKCYRDIIEIRVDVHNNNTPYESCDILWTL